MISVAHCSITQRATELEAAMTELTDWEDSEHGSPRPRSVPGFSSQALRHWRRVKAMLTQAELAEAAGISRGAVSHLEQGRRQPMVTTLRGLCVALDCDPEDLITEGTTQNGDTSQDEAQGYRRREAV